MLLFTDLYPSPVSFTHPHAPIIALCVCGLYIRVLMIWHDRIAKDRRKEEDQKVRKLKIIPFLIWNHPSKWCIIRISSHDLLSLLLRVFSNNNKFCQKTFTMLNNWCWRGNASLQSCLSKELKNEFMKRLNWIIWGWFDFNYFRY